MKDSTEDIVRAVAALHAMSPYQGKLSPSRARELILALSNVGDLVVDPFCGSGTVLLEAWSLGRRALGVDLNPYAVAVASAKLAPPVSSRAAVEGIDRIEQLVLNSQLRVDLRSVPFWVREFYHRETAREAVAWSSILRTENEHFLFGCFLNLLHHQRPGFLSFPAAHVTPHLRSSLFPKRTFPELYEYRQVRSRLQKKVERTLKHGIPMAESISRNAEIGDAASARLDSVEIDCIVTSPPYMSELDYGRDNRIRLWFCGHDDWRTVDSQVSLGRSAFMSLMERCLNRWEANLVPGGHIALVLGDSRRSGSSRVDVPKLVRELVAEKSKALQLIDLSVSEIPSISRAVRNRKGTISESTLIYRKRFK